MNKSYEFLVISAWCSENALFKFEVVWMIFFFDDSKCQIRLAPVAAKFHFIVLEYNENWLVWQPVQSGFHAKRKKKTW